MSTPLIPYVGAPREAVQAHRAYVAAQDMRRKKTAAVRPKRPGRTVRIEKRRIALSPADFINGRPTASRVVRIVAEHFDISVSDLCGSSRFWHFCYCRQIAMYLGRKLTGTSGTLIGVILGGRDHATIFYGHKKIARRLPCSPALAYDVGTIERKVLDGGVFA